MRFRDRKCSVESQRRACGEKNQTNRGLKYISEDSRVPLYDVRIEDEVSRRSVVSVRKATAMDVLWRVDKALEHSEGLGGFASG